MNVRALTDTRPHNNMYRPYPSAPPSQCEGTGGAYRIAAGTGLFEIIPPVPGHNELCASKASVPGAVAGDDMIANCVRRGRYAIRSPSIAAAEARGLLLVLGKVRTLTGRGCMYIMYKSRDD